jgi:sigma-E factor negative regulatory protein RseA
VKDELESQLSAMFDGELPAAECELLSRRIDRDEKLRARWARYVLIGASMRYEPVATASALFAGRVSSALAVLDRPTAQTSRRARLQPPKLVWQSALAASLVVAVAGLSITMLRTAALNSVAVNLGADRAPADPGAVHSARAVQSASTVPAALTAAPSAPWSYVTPAGNDRLSTFMPLRSELTDYIVAHSDYSTPLMRPDLLSALVSAEQRSDDESPADGASGPVVAEGSSPGTGEIDAPAAASPARH